MPNETDVPVDKPEPTSFVALRFKKCLKHKIILSLIMIVTLFAIVSYNGLQSLDFCSRTCRTSDRSHDATANETVLHAVSTRRSAWDGLPSVAILTKSYRNGWGELFPALVFSFLIFWPASYGKLVLIFDEEDIRERATGALLHQMSPHIDVVYEKLNFEPGAIFKARFFEKRVGYDRQQLARTSQRSSASCGRRLFSLHMGWTGCIEIIIVRWRTRSVFVRIHRSKLL